MNKTFRYGLVSFVLAGCSSGIGTEGAATASGDRMTAAEQHCYAIPVTERDVCPLDRSTVLGTKDIVRRVTAKGGAIAGDEGAVVYTLATPGMTREWMGHEIECYQARYHAVGGEIDPHASCPLAVSGSYSEVSSTNNGFAIAIRAKDSDAVQEIRRRSLAKTPPSSRL